MIERIKTNWISLNTKQKKISVIIFCLTGLIMLFLLLGIFNSIVRLMTKVSSDNIFIYISAISLIFGVIFLIGMIRLKNKGKMK